LFLSPIGGGTFLITASKTSLTFKPVFADIKGVLSQGKPIMFSIDSFTLSGSAFGKSILLITGIISKLLSKAK